MLENLILGDCLNIMPKIPSQSIDMILCDLPYALTECEWDILIPFDKLWEQYDRIIKPNGAIVLTASQPFTTMLINSNLKAFKYELIWAKTSCGSFQNAKYMPLKKHENICVFYYNLPRYNPQMLPASPETIRRYKYKFNKLKANGLGHIHSVGESFQNKKDRDSTLKYPDSVLNIPSERGKIHPTQKPVALFEWLIKTYTNENDIILDNAAGVFTTAIASINTNRRYVCIEKDEKYYKLGVEKVKNHLLKVLP